MEMLETEIEYVCQKLFDGLTEAGFDVFGEEGDTFVPPDGALPWPRFMPEIMLVDASLSSLILAHRELPHPLQKFARGFSNPTKEGFAVGQLGAK
jgi:hypothetical protein